MITLISENAYSEIVHIANYDKFWVWAGISRRNEIHNAKMIYLLQGEIFENDFGEPKFIPQGGTQPSRHDQEIWIVYRVRTLNWNDRIYEKIRKSFEHWSMYPGKIVGVQIDFDASTKNLGKYASFLHSLRSRLPINCSISVTGLMDWAYQASPEDLNALSQNIDELVFQTYQGRNTVKNIDSYIERLRDIKIPFLLGVAEDANWTNPTFLSKNPNFKGYVLFLTNKKHREN